MTSRDPPEYPARMRTPQPLALLLSALALMLAACGSEPPSNATTPDGAACSGRGLACPCPNGAGVYVCEGSASRCSCPPTDAAAPDASQDAAPSDAPSIDAPASVDVPDDTASGDAPGEIEASTDGPTSDASDAPSEAGTPCGSMTCAARPGAVAVCTAGECVYACRLGFADCNAREADGCEVDLRSDTANCERCDRACRPLNGVGACVDSTCVLATCNAGFGDCDGMLANGCEVNLRTAVTNCGTCGRACAGSGRSQTQPVCDSGSCVTRCVPYWGDCDGNEANGCEVYLCAAPMNCGRCGHACTPLPHVVTGSVCGGCEGPNTCGVTTPVTCEAGWGECRGGGGPCSTDLMNDPNNCGVCEHNCASPMRCVRGVCQS